MTRSDLPSLLLIGGQGRSGTTMLQKLCDNHPQISISNETKAFEKTGKPFSEYYPSLRKPSRPFFFRNSMTNRWFNFIYYWWFVIRIRGKAQNEVRIADVHQTYHFFFPKASVVGDKYPAYIWQLPRFTAYEGVKIVIIYRDGRDVAQSIHARMLTDWKEKKWAQKKYGDFSKIAARWVTAIETMEEHSDRIHIIRYEEIVTNPGKELIRLAEYLNVDLSGFDPEFISSSSIGKYKHMLTKEQIAEVVKIAGPTLERLGYMDSP